MALVCLVNILYILFAFISLLSQVSIFSFSFSPSLRRFQPVSLLGMSNSEPFVAKDGEEGIKFDFMKRPTLEFHEECSQTAPTSSSSSSQRKEDKEIDVTSARKEDEEKKKELNLKEMDDDDGFKTPTSLDHKIPEPKQCPPAPRKPKSLKRKASPSNSTNAALAVRNLLQLDFPQEVKKTRTQ